MIKAYTALCKLSGLLDMNEDNFDADMVRCAQLWIKAS